MEQETLDILILLSRLILAAIFGAAAIAKFYDPAGTEKAFSDLGIDKSLTRFGVRGLPAAEMITAFLLIIPMTGWYGGLSGLILLVLFTIVLGSAVAQGKNAECHCFGQFSSKPVSWLSLIRNIVFIAPAALIVYAMPRATFYSLYTEISLRLAAGAFLPYILLFSCLILLGVIVYYLRRGIALQEQILENLPAQEQDREAGEPHHHEHMTSPDEGLPIGAVAPDFKLPDMKGRAVSLEQLMTAGRAMLFFFISPTCAPCKALLPEIGKWQEELAGKVDFIFVSSGGAEENAEKLYRLGGQVLLLQNKREVAELFKVRWTPTAVLVNAGGLIASRLAPGDGAIKDLVDLIVDQIRENGEDLSYVKNGRGMSPNDLKIGEELPEFELPAAEGKNITDEIIRGKKTLALFWGVDCPYCRQMLPDVKDWESSGTNGVQLVVFSSGDAEKNRELNLRAPVVIDDGGELRIKLGMYGTPSAVLIDESGKIASETAIGSEQIWSLIGKRK